MYRLGMIILIFTRWSNCSNFNQDLEYVFWAIKMSDWLDVGIKPKVEKPEAELSPLPPPWFSGSLLNTNTEPSLTCQSPPQADNS